MSNKKYKPDERVMTTLRSWEVGKTKNNNIVIKLKFENYIEWNGFNTPKAKQKLMETLALLGFKGSNLGMLQNENALDTTKEVAAVIDTVREYKGKFYHSAKWINNISGGFVKPKDSSIMDELSEVDCRGYIDDTVDDMPAHQEYDRGPKGGFTAEDIPF